MLFNSNILVCNIVSDSEYSVGSKINLGVTFGGNSRNPLYSEMFDMFQTLGVVGSNAKYLEYIKEDNIINIIYYTIKRSSDMSKNIIEYRKVCIPDSITSIEDVRQYINSEIKNLLNPFRFMHNSSEVGIVPGYQEVPTVAAEKGLKFLKDLYSSFNYIRSIDDYRYCNINGKIFIVGIFENGNKREFVLLPKEYSKDYLMEYLNICTMNTLEKIEDIVSSILE